MNFNRITDKYPMVLLPVLLLPLLAGCIQGLTLEEFSNESDIGLIIRNSYQLRYELTGYQIGCNESRNEFWVMDDDMANYFILTCKSFPEVGGTVEADLIYTTADDVKTRSGLSFKVTDADSGTGKIWLWCQPKKIGVIIKVLQ